MNVPASYFDGKSSQLKEVELSVQAGVLMVTGEDIQRVCPLRTLSISERLRHTTRKIKLADGAYLEVADHEGLEHLLKELGFKDSLVVHAQQSWGWALAAFILTINILIGVYWYGLPITAKWVANVLPEKANQVVGQGSLELLDRGLFLPSTLAVEQRKAITERFKQLKLPPRGGASYDILFRKSKIGPNAFALPSGQIVVTDEIVRLMNDDDAVMGILGHELGHLRERHVMQRLIQGSILGVLSTLLLGDVSAIAANIPVVILDYRYSREAEREADDYAIEMMKVNHIPLLKLEQGFEKLQKIEDKKRGDVPTYLSSHPATAERIKHIHDMAH